MAAEKVDICVVTRAYDGQEGRRVKAGTRFAVGKEQGGLPVISKARYEALRLGKIVRPFGEEDTKEAPRYARPLARTVTTMEGTGGPTARAIRDASRRRVKQDDKPGAPKQLAGPSAKTSTGSQTGADAGSSSSPEGQASRTSTSKKSGKRGTRGAAPAAPPPAASSPSTTR